MKKYFLVFLFLCTVAAIYLSFPLNNKEHFVSIKKGSFKLNGKDFYPVAVNYIVSTRADKNSIWASPYFGYTPDSINPLVSKDSCQLQLEADMQLIKEMGFNTVRLVGIGEEAVNKKTGALSVYATMDSRSDTSIALTTDENYNKYFNALDKLFNAANNAGLKIIFLIRTFPEIYSTEDHLKKLAIRFKSDTALMAYDFFNEPLYFDSLERNKIDIRPITKRWNKTMKMYAPNQLSTMGLAGIREVFEWDPNLLDIDFISFHPYDHEPGQVMNELYWYGTYIQKPWILGETAISADNDSITYEEQKQFADKTLKQAFNCGAKGYSWWQYKDVEWHSYLANYMGVVTRKGETKSTKNNLTIKGTVKPVAEAFKKYIPAVKKESCLCPSNYYNWSQHKSFKLTGTLIDESHKPIQGSVVLAWNQNWSHSYHTITKADGSFELYGDFPFYHWIASASRYTMVRAEISPDSAKTSKDNIPSINIGKLKLSKLNLD